MLKKIIGVVVILLLLVYIYFANSKPVNHDYDNMFDTIDSLNVIIDSLIKERKELKYKIDSSENNIKIIEKWYEKEHNTVLNQSVDSDCVFFSNYLSLRFK